MGLMGAIGAGLAEAGGAAAQVGMTQIKAAIEADRDARLSEIRMQEDVTKRERDKAGAAEERTRIAEYSKPGLIQSSPEIAAGSGANDILPGADENVGVDVQNRVRAPTAREAVQRATAAGDLQAMTTLGAEANRVEDNSRADKQQVAQENRWKAEDEKWQRQYSETVRHNKAVEANAAEKLSPAAKAQLDSVTARVSSAQKAEVEAAKALETARKSMADPAAIAQLEGEYRATKALVQTALTQYDAVGEAHFGDKWKKIETSAAAQPAASGAKWDDKTGDVLLDGKVVGKAKNAAEAKAKIAEARAPKTEKQVETGGGQKAPATAEYGLLTSGRLKYLQNLPKRTAKEDAELEQLQMSRNKQQREQRESADTFVAGVTS